MSQEWVSTAVRVLREGGVIAYPTEHCFGLGCDPKCVDAVQRILTIKQRRAEQGLILIGLDEHQLSSYANFAKLTEAERERVLSSWPGPNTWLIPCHPDVSPMVRGSHDTIAVRATAFAPCRELLQAFANPVISTSANRHSKPAILTANDVQTELGAELDYIVNLPVGGASQPSTIRDARSGTQLR